MRYLLPVVLFGALVVVFSIGLNRDPSYVPSPLLGKPAPAFTLPRLDDPEQKLALTDISGQIALLNVWATWCVGCRQEHDTLLELARSSGVPIYGLNWKDDTVLARQWLEQLGDPYVATVVDADGRVAIDYGVYGAPETFLLDADGTVLYKHISPITLDVWREQFLPRIRLAGGNEP